MFRVTQMSLKRCMWCFYVNRVTNAEYGCIKCRIRGEHRREYKKVKYPFDNASLHSNLLRKHDEYVRKGIEATRLGVAIDGHKGICEFVNLVYEFDMIRDVTVDVMHLLENCVGRHLFSALDGSTALTSSAKDVLKSDHGHEELKNALKVQMHYTNIIETS